jgi:hypothetical protein
VGRLTPSVIEALSDAQKKVLRIGMDYELDPAFGKYSSPNPHPILT